MTSKISFRWITRQIYQANDYCLYHTMKENLIKMNLSSITHNNGALSHRWRCHLTFSQQWYAIALLKSYPSRICEKDLQGAIILWHHNMNYSFSYIKTTITLFPHYNELVMANGTKHGNKGRVTIHEHARYSTPENIRM